MKKYCPRCLKVFTCETACPDCKKHPALTVPDANEPVLLAKVDYLLVEMLKPLLKDAGIPALYKGGFSDVFAMNMGMRLDVIHVLVPFSAHDEAEGILSMLSGTYDAEAEITENPTDEETETEETL